MIQNLLGMVNAFVEKYLYGFSIPRFNRIDFVEIIIISLLVYNILVWVKNTRAWVLLRGIIIIVIFCLTIPPQEPIQSHPDEYHTLDCRQDH